MLEENNSRKVFLSVLGVAILLVAVVGVSFAAFTYSRTSENTNSIATGTITMTYTEPTNGILIENALPITDTEGMALNGDKNVFPFTVTVNATGSVTIPYEINIVKDATSTIPDQYVKIALSKGTTPETVVEAAQTMAALRVAENASTLSSGNYTLHDETVTFTAGGPAPANATTNYVLRMWVASDAPMNDDNSIANKTYKITVNVNSNVNAIGA